MTEPIYLTLPSEGTTSNVVVTWGPTGTFKITQSDGQREWTSAAIAWGASLGEMRVATRHMPLTLSRPQEPWWARVIGRALAAMILLAQVRTRLQR